MFVCISFSDSVCNSCLPSRTCSPNGDAWASAPTFHLFGSCCFGFAPAGHLESRQQSSIRLLLEDSDQPFQPSLCNEVCKSIDGRRPHQQCSPLFLLSRRRKRFFSGCSLFASYHALLRRLRADWERKQKPVPEGTVPHTRDRLHVLDRPFVQMYGGLSNPEETVVLQA